MIAVDTNVLVYSHRADSAFHSAAARCISDLAAGSAPWAIPWPCLHEFLAVVTHPRIYDPPTPVAVALDQVEAWLEVPSLVLLAETEQYWSALRSVVTSSRITGARIHDARVAALCRHHGIRELWSADRDFGRFSGLAVRNPLV
ncbi:MAG TPA: TA system VapC family ribonuclease toxin [Xanthobacteraceae bacterium]